MKSDSHLTNKNVSFQKTFTSKWVPFKENSPEWLREKNLLYNKEVTCPICGNVFKAKAVKTSAYRMIKKDTDLFIRYSVVNPYFYDVWLCNSCGYAAMKSDFNKIRNFQLDAVKERITPTWNYKEYPEVYNIDIAIERYKISLLNYVVIESKWSAKAMNSLKLSWMYRLKNNSAKETLFLNQALEAFKEAYSSENFPIYGMDKYTTMYLIGELLRRTGNSDEALRWLSNVVTSHGINIRLKNLARDQKDLIKEEKLTETKLNLDKPTQEDTNIKKDKKIGFFSRFFKK